MDIFSTIPPPTKWQSIQASNITTLGFVPTMGALHSGHITLIERSLLENDYTICSIFINPTQFDNSDDLQAYPKNLKKDIQLLESAGCDAVFVPEVDTMYPGNQEVNHYSFGGLEYQMEGKFRLGHFDGVATIVSRFFDIIKPTRAYFGEKDFQQLRIIQELVKLKNYPVQVVGMPISRASDGLALSSRNARLTNEYRDEAPEIYRILNLIQDWKLYYSVNETIEKVEKAFEKTKLELEYILITDEKTLEPISTWDESENIRAFVAAYANDIRLIDNIKIG